MSAVSTCPHLHGVQGAKGVGAGAFGLVLAHHRVELLLELAKSWPKGLAKSRGNPWEKGGSVTKGDLRCEVKTLADL